MDCCEHLLYLTIIIAIGGLLHYFQKKEFKTIQKNYELKLKKDVQDYQDLEKKHSELKSELQTLKKDVNLKKGQNLDQKIEQQVEKQFNKTNYVTKDEQSDLCQQLQKLENNFQDLGKQNQQSVESSNVLKKQLENEIKVQLKNLTNNQKETLNKLEQVKKDVDGSNLQFSKLKEDFQTQIKNVKQSLTDTVNQKTSQVIQNETFAPQILALQNQYQILNQQIIENGKQTKAFSESQQQLISEVDKIKGQLKAFSDELLKLNSQNQQFAQELDKKIQSNEDEIQLKLIEQFETFNQTSQQSPPNIQVENYEQQIQSLHGKINSLEEELIQQSKYTNTLVVNLQEILPLLNKQYFSDFEELLKTLGSNINKQSEVVEPTFLVKIKESLKKIQDYLSQFQIKQQFEFDEIRMQTSNQIINEIYQNSWKRRTLDSKFQYFVRDVEQEQDLHRNYSIRASAAKEKLRKICTSFRQARGDGNCFYTAFGYQFLLILLMEYSDREFTEFLEQIKKLNLPMKLNVQKYNQEQEQELLKEFMFRIERLRLLPESQREEQFTIEFAAYDKFSEEIDGVFYGLSTIFFRNLANFAVEFSEMKEALFDRENLLNWEQECNSNEIVIEALAKYLKIRIQLVFFDNGGLEVKEYFDTQPYKIILLIKPGHYSIGIKQKSQQLTFETFCKLIQNETQLLLSLLSEKKEEKCDQQPEQTLVAQQIDQYFSKIADLTQNQQQIIQQKAENLEKLLQQLRESQNKLLDQQNSQVVQLQVNLNVVEQQNSNTQIKEKIQDICDEVTKKQEQNENQQCQNAIQQDDENQEKLEHSEQQQNQDDQGDIY